MSYYIYRHYSSVLHSIAIKTVRVCCLPKTVHAATEINHIKYCRIHHSRVELEIAAKKPSACGIELHYWRTHIFLLNFPPNFSNMGKAQAFHSNYSETRNVTANVPKIKFSAQSYFQRKTSSSHLDTLSRSCKVYLMPYLQIEQICLWI